MNAFQIPMKKLIVDLDNTLTMADADTYPEMSVNKDVVKKLALYRANGFSITINTSRNMRTYEGNVGKINIHTLPVILEWLDEHDVPYDEVLVGKPWCGTEGFYIDDRAIRPDEFVSLSPEEISRLIGD